MTLSEQQLTFFETFGYLVFPGLFADEADAISDEFERVWAEHGGGHHGRPHDNTRRSALLPFIDQSGYLSALLDDPRIDDVASLLLGDDYNYEDSDGNYYVGDTNWHSDGYALEISLHQVRLLSRSGRARLGVPARDSRQPPLRGHVRRVGAGDHGQLSET